MVSKSEKSKYHNRLDVNMEIENITLENFQKKVTYSHDPNPGEKLVISNGAFVECIIQLKLINTIEKLRLTII